MVARSPPLPNCRSRSRKLSHLDELISKAMQPRTDTGRRWRGRRRITLAMSVTVMPFSRRCIGSGTTYCEDNPSGPDAPVHVEDWREIDLPPGITDFNAIISQTGDIWKQWGGK